MMGRSATKLVEAVASCFVRLPMYISGAISKWYMKTILRLDLSCEVLSPNCTGLTARSFRSRTEIGSGEHLASLELFQIVGAGIHKRFFTFQIKLLAELLQEHFESVAWAAIFENE